MTMLRHTLEPLNGPIMKALEEIEYEGDFTFGSIISPMAYPTECMIKLCGYV